MDVAERRDHAWIGDAVLALYARSWILEQSDIPRSRRAEEFKALTSNEFLSEIGEPTRMEATIGQVYALEGLESAFEWIESNCIPLYLKKRENLRKSSRGKKR